MATSSTDRLLAPDPAPPVRRRRWRCCRCSSWASARRPRSWRLAALDADVDRALERRRCEVAGRGRSSGRARRPARSEHESRRRGQPAGRREHGPARARRRPGAVVLNRDRRHRRRACRTHGAVAAAGAGRDMRTVATSDGEVRLADGPDHRPTTDGARSWATCRAASTSTLHDQQSRSLVLAILVVGAARPARRRRHHARRHRARARPDPRGLRGPAAVRGRRLARAADARRAHPGERRGPRARGARRRATGATSSRTSSPRPTASAGWSATCSSSPPGTRRASC